MVRLHTTRSVGFALRAGLLLLGGCALPSASPWREPPPAPRVEGPQEPVFCYRTLADVECYFERDRSVPGRLVAVYPRPTGDPASTTYWRRPASGAPDPAAAEPGR
jgi:hypothetical protein